MAAGAIVYGLQAAIYIVFPLFVFAWDLGWAGK